MGSRGYKMKNKRERGREGRREKRDKGRDGGRGERGRA